MRSPVFRRPGCRRHAGTADGCPQNATPEAVAGRHRATRPNEPHTLYTVRCTQHHGESNSPAPPPGCDWVERPAHRPRMSPRPRVAKYGATHSCHTSGVANYLASRHRASVAAPAPRQTIRHVRRNHPHPHAPRNNRRYSLCDASIAIAATRLTYS